MHQIRLSPALLARAHAQRGAEHVFDPIDIRRTAHIVVDLQNCFMEPGAPVEVPTAREIVQNVNAISSAVRARGGQNVFLRMTVDAQSRSSWSTFFRYMNKPDIAEVTAQALTAGAHYWRLWPELEVTESDLTVEKTRFGAFVPGASRLHEILQAIGIDTLIITGTLTNCCCESTARDAMQMNYKILFVSDATAALTDAEHNATLENIATLFGDVVTTQEILAAVARAR
jgi:ureidoacrylate peracid hydrolase